jgi:hypothetical protein
MTIEDDAYNAGRARLTPAADVSLHSIAISLARIADAVTTTDYHGRQSSLADELSRIRDKI